MMAGWWWEGLFLAQGGGSGGGGGDGREQRDGGGAASEKGGGRVGGVGGLMATLLWPRCLDAFGSGESWWIGGEGHPTARAFLHRACTFSPRGTTVDGAGCPLKRGLIGEILTKLLVVDKTFFFFYVRGLIKSECGWIIVQSGKNGSDLGNRAPREH